MFKNFGNPNVTRPPATINRWSPDECHQEWDFVNCVIKGVSFPFKGQYHCGFLDRRPNAVEFNNMWRNDMGLQNIIAGRGEAKYKKTIEKYQKLYHDRIRQNLPTNIPVPMNDSTTNSSLESTSQSQSIKSEYLLKLESRYQLPVALGNMELVSQAKSTSDEGMENMQVSKRLRPSLKRNQCRQSITPKAECWQNLSIIKPCLSSIEIIAERNVFPAGQSFKIQRSLDEEKIEDICTRLIRHPSDWYKIELESTGN
jgi:hypothetical protein